MSRIDELISDASKQARIRWATLGEICKSISAGGDLPANYRKGQTSPSDEFPYPIYSNGSDKNALYGYADTFKVAEKAVTISARGTIGFHAIREANFTPIVRLLVLIPNGDTISPEYLNYALDITEIGHSGGSIPQLTVPNVKRIRVPVPPLEIQHEIVKILDTFTQLEEELEEELEARQKQYHYYRERLLNFDNRDDVRWATLGEIGKVSMCKRIFKNETSSQGEIPFYKIGTFGGTPDAFISRELYQEYRSRYPFPKKGDILISAAGTIGRAIPYDGEDAYFQDSNIVWIDNDESLVTNKYLWHWYQVVEWTTEGGTIQRLYNENLRHTKIPIPPIEEQERIVAILDKFDALVNDLSSGLPAEIKARRQQYEYYRDRLLTFKEAV